MRAIKVLKYCIFLLLLVAILAKADPVPNKAQFVTSKFDANEKDLPVNKVLGINIKKGIDALRRIPKLLKKFVKKHTGKKSKGSGKNDHDNDPRPPIAPAPVFPPKVPPPRPRPVPQPVPSFSRKKSGGN